MKRGTDLQPGESFPVASTEETKGGGTSPKNLARFEAAISVFIDESPHTAEPSLILLRIAPHLDNIQSATLVERHRHRINYKRLCRHLFNTKTIGDLEGCQRILGRQGRYPLQYNVGGGCLNAISRPGGKKNH